MSIILDALKKSEAERKANTGDTKNHARPSQSGEPREPSAPGSPKGLAPSKLTIVLIAGLVVTIGGIGYMALSVDEPSTPKITQAPSEIIQEPETAPETAQIKPEPKPLPKPEPAIQTMQTMQPEAGSEPAPAGKPASPVAPVSLNAPDPEPKPEPEPKIVPEPMAVADPLMPPEPEPVPVLEPVPDAEPVPEPGPAVVNMADTKSEPVPAPTPNPRPGALPIRVENNRQAESHFKNAQQFDRDGHYAQANEQYSLAIKLLPGNAIYYLGRGWSYIARNNYESAILDFGTAIRLQKNFANAFYGRGWAYEKNAQPSQAMENYSQAIAISPGHVDAMFSRGFLKFYNNNMRHAEQDFTKVYETAATELKDFALLWSYLSYKRTTTPGAEPLQPYRDIKTGTTWPAIIYSAFMGRATTQQVVAAMKSDNTLTQRRRESVGYFFLAQDRLIRGDLVMAAQYFQKTLQTGVTSYRQYPAAKIELKRLRSPD